MDGFWQMKTRTATSDECVRCLTGTFVLVTVHLRSHKGYAVDPSHPSLMLHHENHGLERAMLSFQISCALGSPGGVILSDHPQLLVQLFHRS